MTSQTFERIAHGEYFRSVVNGLHQQGSFGSSVSARAVVIAFRSPEQISARQALACLALGVAEENFSRSDGDLWWQAPGGQADAPQRGGRLTFSVGDFQVDLGAVSGGR